MLKVLSRQPWTCPRCLLHQQRSALQPFRRRIQTATSPVHHDYKIASNNAPGTRHDDHTLGLVFDSKPFWREFSQRKAASSAKPTGLLQNEYLTGPDGFREFALVTLQKCQEIVSKVLAVSTLEGYRAMARDMDRLSDLLCRVIDTAEFMRTNHPDPEIQDAATQAYALMFEYMNVLNTTTALNDQLKHAYSHPDVISHWNEEERVTVQMLMKDFAKSAIDLPPKERQKFVTLHNEISQLGSAFVNGMEPETPQLSFDKRKLQGMDPVMLSRMRKWTSIVLPLYGSAPRTALGMVHDENVRREIYLAYRTSSKRQVHRLEELLRKRTELAKLAGYPSYAHMTLSDKMAKTPEAVANFLTSLNANNWPLVRGELSKLMALKQSVDPSASQFHPWDHSYFMNRYAFLQDRSRKSRAAGSLRSFFSLGTVMQGLSRLFTRLYGVRFVPHETGPGETWNSDVRRLDVLDEDNNHLAVVYCDLFTRPGKTPNPAHFALRCSRAISQAEIAESANISTSRHPNDGMATAMRPGTKTLYQLPTIALICDFEEPPSSDSRPSLLSEHNVQTLFHEMGHAIHSILGSTDLQSISGTRCATDFAELPSVLMESFATSPQVLSLYARHWETGAPMPEEMMRSMARSQEDRAAMHGAMDNEVQILMAMLDQAYHTADATERNFDTTTIYHRVYSEHSSLPDPSGSRTSWQGNFAHLYGYGSTYYSYLFDRAIASKIWSEVFKGGEGAVDRDAGERFKEEVLRWGGGRDGWHCVAGVLGSNHPANKNGRLAEGREEAMREVGLWGLADSSTAQ
ncbi:hypothetical protein AJ80_08483 [Polytolypa hystricis UAMH7299]|uniref:Mitochondrial intermediate peptidase n=1 Tax=Polytolypa hystricis (strain UAMH7299) TaxID=1447883 RepID=A0A2B7X6W5_POLH7|nr:hypothetical protein AJ80_08483 [Polytolypa hystricis UAMH7299]